MKYHPEQLEDADIEVVLRTLVNAELQGCTVDELSERCSLSAELVEAMLAVLAEHGLTAKTDVCR